jgi:hypothetical protein
LFVDGHNALGRNDNSTGYYVGAGTDLMLTRDAWGLAEKVGILGEIGVEYKRWSSKTVANSDTTGVTGVSNGVLSKVQVTMLTVDVAPKVKFRQGTDFQPWVIPVGLDFHVISPPSNQTNYLDIGVQFGVGGIPPVERAVARRGRPLSPRLGRDQYRQQLRDGRCVRCARILEDFFQRP